MNINFGNASQWQILEAAVLWYAWGGVSVTPSLFILYDDTAMLVSHIDFVLLVCCMFHVLLNCMDLLPMGVSQALSAYNVSSISEADSDNHNISHTLQSYPFPRNYIQKTLAETLYCS